jgi:hypothetical protein
MRARPRVRPFLPRLTHLSLFISRIRIKSLIAKGLAQRNMLSDRGENALHRIDNDGRLLDIHVVAALVGDK